MYGVVSAVGAYALAVEERADVTADLVDVEGLVCGDDFKEHGFQAYDTACWDCGGVCFFFCFFTFLVLYCW